MPLLIHNKVRHYYYVKRIELKMPRRRKQPEGKVLRAFPLISSQSFEIPGLSGRRPLLTLVLKVVSGKHPLMIREHLECYLYSDFQIRTLETTRALETMIEQPEFLGYAASQMMSTMQELVDMWIDSGKSGGIDAPADRNVEEVLQGRSFSLFQLIDQLLFSSYPRYTAMRRDGTTEVKDNWPRFSSNDLSVYGLKGALENYGRRMAMYQFVRFLDSPYSHHISRCDHCKSYFAYRRSRLRTVKSGVFCRKCAPKSALKRTQLSRSRRLDSAAKAVLLYEIRQIKADQREWIAEQVNKSHGTAFGRRWFSQNKTAILQRAEILRNAKA